MEGPTVGVFVGSKVGVVVGEVSRVGVGVSCANTFKFGVEITINKKPMVTNIENVDFLIMSVDQAVV